MQLTLATDTYWRATIRLKSLGIILYR